VSVQVERNTLQLFRATLAALASPPADEAHTAHLATSPLAVLDLTRHINFLASTPPSLWSSLMDCASATLKALSTPHAPVATLTQLTFPATPHAGALFDAMLSVRLPAVAQASAQELSADMPRTEALARRATRLLSRALTDRVKHVSVLAPAPEASNADQGVQPVGQAGRWLHVGLLLDSKEVRLDVPCAHLHADQPCLAATARCLCTA
jgi:Nrap protein domain 3